MSAGTTGDPRITIQIAACMLNSGSAITGAGGITSHARGGQAGNGRCSLGVVSYQNITRGIRMVDILYLG